MKLGEIQDFLLSPSEKCRSPASIGLCILPGSGCDGDDKSAQLQAAVDFVI